MAWIGVKVVDRGGRPQPGVEVGLYRSDPVSWTTGVQLVASAVTDKNGMCGFGVWDVWYTYVVHGVRSKDDFQTELAFVSIGPFESKNVQVVGSGPPHYYLMKVTVNVIPAGFVDWLVEQLKGLLEAVYPIEIKQVWLEGNTVFIRFVIHCPVSVIVAIIIILGLLVALGVVTWFVVKEFHGTLEDVFKAVPSWTWGLIAVSLATVGVATLIYTFKH